MHWPKHKKIYIIRIIPALILSFIFWINYSLAAYKVEMPLPNAPTSISDPGQYIKYLFQFGFYLVAFLAVAMITYGGILYMIPNKIAEAKEKIWGAVIGVVFLLCSFLILQTIDPNLLNLTPRSLAAVNLLEAMELPQIPHEGFNLTTEQIENSAIVRGTEYGNIVNGASNLSGVSPELIKAVILTESSGKNGTCSSAGACGLMQIMPGTFKQYSGGLGAEYRFDPTQNVAAGTKYLSALIRKYNGDTATALAAYNWGPGNVDKKCGGNIAGCNLPRETAAYVPKVLGYMNTIRN